METKSIVINAMEPSLVKDAVEAVQARYPANDPNHQGHRTRPGLSPQQAAQDLIGRTATANRACVIYDNHGAILAIRYRPDAGCKEAWEGVAVAGHPADECYRQAYDELFDHNERPAPAGSTSLSNIDINLPKDPRPTKDGWAVSIWFTNHAERIATAHRLVVKQYEQHLIPDLCNYRKQSCVVRMAESGE